MTLWKAATQVMEASIVSDNLTVEPRQMRRMPWAVVVLLIALYAIVSFAALYTIGNPYRAGLREAVGQSLGAVGRWAGPAFETRADLTEQAASEAAAAKAKIANGDLPGAAEAYRKRLEVLEALSERDLADTATRREIYVTHMALGLLAESTARLPDARQEYRAAIAILRPVADHEPENIGWQNDLSEAQERLDALDAGQGLNTDN